MDSKGPKIRDDLILSQQEQRGTVYFVVKDPSTRKFFRFKEAERFIIRHLDGEHSPEDVQEKFQAEIGAPLPAETLASFIESLRSLGLLEGEGQPQKTRVSRNPFYLKFKLFDPDRLLTRLLPRVRFFFTRSFLRLSAGLVFLGVVLTAANSQEIAQEMPRLFRVSSAVLIWLTVIGVVWAHEFAHGLTCKKYGGEVREMGFLLLFFMPAFYCNVSDAWLFPERRKKLAVIFAGAYFEVVLWAAATVLWRITPPETTLHFLALIVMATSGAKVLFNFNPLIRLDGYYLLSDFLEIPNLRAKAMAYLKALLGGNFGVRKRVAPRERRIYLIYGVLAGAYTVLILAFIARWAGGFLIGRFQELGFVLFLVLLAILFRNPLTRLVRKSFRLTPTGEEVRKVKRLLKVGLPLAALGALLYFVHSDLKISTPFQVAPRENADVRAEVEGIIQKVFVREGDRVKQGDPLALLSAREYAAEAEKVRKQMAEKEARLRLLRAGARPEKINLGRQEVDTARTELLFRKRQLEEGKQMRRGRLVKAGVSLDKAATRLRFARQYFKLKERLFKEGLISRKEHLEAQEALQLREKEREESQEEVRIVESDRLVTLKGGQALAEKRLKEAERRLDLLLAGSRKEEIDAVEAELARLKVEEAHLQSQIKLTRIVSPAAGIVTTPKLEEKVGELVKKGELILEVYDFSSVIAEMAVPEKEVGDIEIGQPVILKARSFPGRTFHGRVTAIAPVATEEQLQRIVTVRSEIPNPGLLLRPGMSGNAKIVAGRRRLGELFTRRLSRAVRVEFWSWF